jgi:hypothetical protein
MLWSLSFSLTEMGNTFTSCSQLDSCLWDFAYSLLLPDPIVKGSSDVCLYDCPSLQARK